MPGFIDGNQHPSWKYSTLVNITGTWQSCDAHEEGCLPQNGKLDIRLNTDKYNNSFTEC